MSGRGGGDGDARRPRSRSRTTGSASRSSTPTTSGWARSPTSSARAGGSATANQGIGIDDDNAIFLSRYELAAEVGEDNVDDAHAELDGVVSELVGTDVTGERADVGGLIAFRYDDFAVTPPVDGESDLTFVFDGDVQYQLNCQSTPTHRDRMDEACELAVDTLVRRLSPVGRRRAPVVSRRRRPVAEEDDLHLVLQGELLLLEGLLLELFVDRGVRRARSSARRSS